MTLWCGEITSTKPRWKRVFLCFSLPFDLFMLLYVSPALYNKYAHGTVLPNQTCCSTMGGCAHISTNLHHLSPHLWNQLPVSLRQPCINHPADDVTLSNSPPTCSPVTTPLPSHIHCFIRGSKLTSSTNLFHHSLLASTHLDCLHGL